MYKAIHAIFDRYNISPIMRNRFIDTFFSGLYDTELYSRIQHVENYRQCQEELQARLSADFQFKAATQETDMVIARDFTKREIKVGDKIAYPVRQGSRMWLKDLVVRQIATGPDGPFVAGTNTKGRRVSVKNLENVVIIPNEDVAAPEV